MSVTPKGVITGTSKAPGKRGQETMEEIGALPAGLREEVPGQTTPEWRRVFWRPETNLEEAVGPVLAIQMKQQ